MEHYRLYILLIVSFSALVSCSTEKDNGADSYEKLVGNWTFNAINNKGDTISYPMVIASVKEGETGYDRILTASFTYPFMGISPTPTVVFPMTYFYNKSTKEPGYVGIQCSQTNVVYAYNSSYQWFFMLYNPSLNANQLINGELAGVWNEDYSKCTFNPSCYIYFYKLAPPSAGYWAYWTKISFVRSN